MSNYREPVDEEHDHLMTVEEFRKAVGVGAYIDYDGYGNPVRDGRADPSVVVSPSKVDSIPADATHVVWFNR